MGTEGGEILGTEGWSWILGRLGWNRIRMRHMEKIRACRLILGKKGIRTRGRLKLF